MYFGLNQINGYLRRGLHLERFDPSRRLIELRIWIYAGLLNIEKRMYIDPKQDLSYGHIVMFMKLCAFLLKRKIN